MTTATALVIPALRDVRDAQATVADTFRAHYAVTPDGPHRQSLRQHADDAREHLRRLDERLEDLQPRRPVLHPLNLARQATRVVLLSLEAAMGIPAALLPARGETLARRLLRNTEDEYTIASPRRTEPWPGYESMNVNQIRVRLRQTDPTLARKVLDYERDREQRPTITTAAERAAGTPRPAGPTTR